MSSRKLKRLGLCQITQERLAKHNIHTCKDLLSKNALELLRIVGQSYDHVTNLLHTVSHGCSPTPVKALDLWRAQNVEHPAYLATSLTQLDQVLHGGLPNATISEIAGPSGCGKTQFCVMLSILATLPTHMGGLDGGVIYIDTESAFSAERLVEMAETRFPEIFGSEKSIISLTENIHVHVESTSVSLMKRLEIIEEELIDKKIRLIVIDSIASLVRKEYDSRGGRSLIDRTNLLARQAAILKYIAETFHIPVVVTNQITTRFGSNSPPVEDVDNNSIAFTQGAGDGDGGYVTAALGNTWSHSINTRLIVQYLDGQNRQVMVAKSPIAPFSTFVYTIQDKGLVLQEGGADHYEGTDPGLQKIRVRSSIPQDAFSY